MFKVEDSQVIKKSLLIGAGMAAYAQERTEKLAKELIRKGKANKAEGKKLVKTVYQEAEKSRKKVTSVIEKEVMRLLKVAEKKAVKKKPAKKKTKKKK